MDLKKNWFEKSVIGLLVILNVLFLYYWVVLSANYCLHYDDAHFLWKMREYSLFEYVKEMYITRGGNFMGYGLNWLIFTIANIVGDYHFWPMAFYTLGIFITWGAFRNIPWIKNSGYKGWLGIVTLYNVYILTSIDYAVFTWLCAMPYYIYGPLLCLIVRYLYVEKLRWWQWILLLCSAMFLAGSSVSISTVCFMVLFLLGMWMWYGEKWNVRNTWNKPQVRRLLGITALMLIIFAIVYMAPGNWNRMDDEFDIEQPQNLMQFVRAIAVCVGMFLYMMSFYLPYHLIAVAMGAWVGKKYPMCLSMGRNKAILITLAVAIGYLIMCVLPLAYLSNGFQIQRNYTQLCYFYMITFFMLGYLWTCDKTQCKRVVSDAFIRGAISVCTLFLIVIMCFNIRQDLPVARAYNKAHKDRIEYLLELQAAGQKETVVVERYPSVHTPDAKYMVFKWLGKETYMPAIYYESDIEATPNGYESHLRKIYGIDFDFVLPSKED